MDYQQQPPWRPRPPIQGHICPTCSFPHFPFCPPPLPPPPHPSFNQTPPFDAYRPPANAHRPIVGNPSPPPPYGHSSYGYGFPPQSHEFGDGYRSNKRPRVDDDLGFGFGSGSGSVLSDDERRLKLIREHGGAPSPSERNGFNCDASQGNPSLFRQLESGGDESSGNQSYLPADQLPQHHGMQSPSLGRLGHNPMHASPRFYAVHPPLPASSPPPLPMDSPLQPRRPPSLFPVPVSSSAMSSSSCPPPIPDGQCSARPYFHSKHLMHTSTGFATQV